MGVVNGQKLIFFGGGDGVCYAFAAEPQKGDGSPIVPVVPGPPINRTEDTDTMYLKKVWWFDCNPPERRASDATRIQWLVARLPRSRPASASRYAPVQTEHRRRTRGPRRRSQARSRGSPAFCRSVAHPQSA